MFHFICPREDANRSILLFCLKLHPKSNFYVRVISCSAFILSFCRVHCFSYHLQFTEKTICVWFSKRGCVLYQFLKTETRQSLVISPDLRIPESQNCLGVKEPLEIISSIQTLSGSSRVISRRLFRTMFTQVLSIYMDGCCWLLYNDNVNV